MNDKTFGVIFIIVIILIMSQIILMFTNRKLFCKIAMFGGVGNVPAICLKDTLMELRNE